MTETVALLLALSAAHHNLGDLYAELAASDHNMRPVDLDVLTLARAIQGEEAGKFGENRGELGEWIAHTALNRWEKDWWKQIDGVPCTFAARVEYDWHGTRLVEQPEPWAVRIASNVIENRKVGGTNFTAGALFAMSLEDLTTNGWTEKARQSYVNIVISDEDPTVQFWFLTDHPQGE